MPRPISAVALSEILCYEETINGVAQTVAYWPLWKESDGVVLLRAPATDENHKINNTNVSTYIDGLMDTWLNDAEAGYLSRMDAKMQACIIPTTIKIKPAGTDAVTEVARQVFLLAESNVVAAGGVEGDSILSVLKIHTGETSDNNARKAYNSAGTAVVYWLRSAASAEQCRYVNSFGSVGSYDASNNCSARPAFKVSKDTMVSDETEDTIYILPDATKLYRELEFVTYVGTSENRPKKARVAVDITNATESQIWVSNNAKDEEPVWVACTNGVAVELPNTTKTTDNWELGVKIYAKSGGKAVCGEPVVMVEVDA